MTPFAFDTLSASKRLREAGMEEGVAEAVVSVFQHAAEPIDLSHLATKADLTELGRRVDLIDKSVKADIIDVAHKSDITDVVRKADIEDMVRRADIVEMATKTDLAVLKNELSADIRIAEATLRAEFNEKIRQQGWTILGGVAVLLTISTAATRLLA